MDPSTNRPSPHSLQGPRPTSLSVRKDSYKITKKPPPKPVIIYEVSPKVIHIAPRDFKNVVQRLTGMPSPSAALPPAARFATFEKADKLSPLKNDATATNDHIIRDDNGVQGRTSTIPGILSPQPSSLQPIPSSFFSPIPNFDPGIFNDLSPLASGGGGGGGGGGDSFMTNPTSFLSNPNITSPGSYWDPFNDPFNW